MQGAARPNQNLRHQQVEPRHEKPSGGFNIKLSKKSDHWYHHCHNYFCRRVGGFFLYPMISMGWRENSGQHYCTLLQHRGPVQTTPNLQQLLYPQGNDL